ncbi:MAG: Ig-like domain-containing protein [Firmicutes bacterium]|nr:Ig-like domain-containing protein [Bacillota bacterium]
MKHSYQKLFAILLALTMVFTMSAGIVFAEGEDGLLSVVTSSEEDGEDPGEPEPEPDPAPVDPEPDPEPLSVEMSRGSIDIGVGGTSVIMAAAYGGTGSYQYSWSSSNPFVVSVQDNGSSADIYAVGTGTAEIELSVYDGETTVRDSCTVHVSEAGGSATFDISASTNADKDLPMDTIAGQLASAFAQKLGRQPGSSATIKLDHTSDWTGLVCMQNGDMLMPGSNYSFATFRMMTFFEPANIGNFETAYTITDENSVLTGTISISVKDTSSRSITAVSISKSSITMDTYSSRTLSVSVSPNNASYRVEWESNNTSIVTADSNSSSVTVYSRGKEGSTRVYVTVTDLSTGQTYTKSCSVTVETEDSTPSSKGGKYNPGLSLTYGSDYYGTGISDSIYNEFHNRYGIYLADSAKVSFSNMKTSYGYLELATGYTVRDGSTYTFGEFRDMSFSPSKAGTWSSDYSVTYSNKTLSGTMSLYINGSSLSVTLSNTSLKLAPYSSQYLYVTVTPNSSYKISWSSDTPSVASVAGNGTAATINTFGKAGTAKIKVTVTDKSGLQTVKTCTVTVTANGSSDYSPSVATYIGNTTKGTAIYDSLKSQFKNVYGVTLPDTAEIKFTNSGDSKIAIRKLANGKAVAAKTTYTMAQYKTMYTDPVSEGTFTVPYTLTYKNNKLSGNITVNVSAAPVNVGIALPSVMPYRFDQPLDGVSGSVRLCGAVNGAVNNAAEATWSYVRVLSTAGTAGVLYLNSGMAAITPETNITPAMMNDLYFVPNQSGTYVAQIAAYNQAGKVVERGNLYITVPGGAPVNPSGLKVQPTTQTIKVNGKIVDPEAYNINGMNYFKLRAIAYLLDNTSSQFSISYDYTTRAIGIVTGAPYDELGTEMQKGPDMSSKCVYSTIEVYVNGFAMNLTSYNIGGSTYFQLAELGNVLGFNVGYDEATRTVMINSK